MYYLWLQFIFGQCIGLDKITYLIHEFNSIFFFENKIVFAQNLKLLALGKVLL